MANRTQSKNFLTSAMGLGAKPSSTTLIGLFSELNKLDGLYYIPGMTVDHYGSGGPIVQVKITLNAAPIAFTDQADTIQYGGMKIYDFPEGHLCILGAVIDGSVAPAATSDEGTLTAGFAGDVAIGTVTATTGASLTSTEADILQSTATTTAVAGVANCDAQSIATALTESGARWLDGTATANDAYLNFIIDDAAAHRDSVGTVTAVVYLTYLMLGDN